MESVEHVDFGGFYLTHAIWHNGYGACPETGVRSHADGLKDFRLIQHNVTDWPLVTVVCLAALSKGWDTYRIERIIEWLHGRNRKRQTRAKFSALHDTFVHTLTGCGGPTETRPDRPTCKRDGSCCDFVCGN